MPKLAHKRRANMDALVAAAARALRFESRDLCPIVRLRIEVETEIAYQQWTTMEPEDQATFEGRPEVAELFRARATIDQEILSFGEGGRSPVVQSGEAGRRDH